MIFSVKVNQTTLDSIARRIIKVLGIGLVDVQVVPEIAPFGIDSNPLDGMIAICAETSKRGKPVILGYLNKDQVAGKGEIRIFSKNAAGVQQTYLWIKANGTIEIGGSTNHMTQFEALKAAFDAFIIEFNAHTHATAGTGPPSPPVIPSSASIDAAKINTVKTL